MHFRPLANYLLVCTLWVTLPATLWAQKTPDNDVLQDRGPFTATDSLRGTYSALQQATNVLYYNLQLAIDPTQQTVSGEAFIQFEIRTAAATSFRFELDTAFSVLAVKELVWAPRPDDVGEKPTPAHEWTKDGRFYTVALPGTPLVGAVRTLIVKYSGKPHVAQNAPWDGGFVWAKDPAGKPWVSVACQSEGASLWWPCKDHPNDEPERGIDMTITVPNGLVAVGNGRLTAVSKATEQSTAYTWQVTAPINLYAVNVTVGDFAHIHGVYKSPETKDTLSLDYYVVRANEAKARAHFAKEVPPMLAAFEARFGAFPWYKDGYKLVETPYWGMEHQSNIAYGNNYQHLPGWFPFPERGLFDYIIVHESGHEWFGNSLTHTDKADMWIHESFTTYAEAVYIEHRWGPEKAQAYLDAQRLLIQNTSAIQGPRGVAFDGWPDSDMYFKGAWLLHTLRHANQGYFALEGKSAAAADSFWWQTLRQYYATHTRTTLSTETVVAFFAKTLGEWARPIFDQYLNYKSLPVLETKLLPADDANGFGSSAQLTLVFKAQAPGFELPVLVQRDPGSEIWVRLGTLPILVSDGVSVAPRPMLFQRLDTSKK
jgi:aminopeptidase N